VSEHLLPFQEDQMKKCKKCSIEKPLSSFHKNKRIKDGYHYYCKECITVLDKVRYTKNTDGMTLAAKKYYANNREKVKSRHLKKMYGLDLATHESMRKQQMFSCLICNDHEDNSPRGLFVDHCHTTGKVRGLLCHHCNAMLGLAKDNKETLEKAIKYLDAYTSTETID